jgi:hypothetical protein
MPASPKDCKVFFVTEPSDYYFSVDTNIASIYRQNVAAMLISDHVNLPTINGFSSFLPPDWDFSEAPHDNYLGRVRRYVQIHHIKDICEYNIKNYSWKTDPFDNWTEYGALSPAGFNVKLEPKINEITLAPGKRSAVIIQVSNISDARWSSVNLNPLVLSYHIKTADGKSMVEFDGARTVLPGDIMPGQKIALSAIVIAPQIRGKYLLEFDLVQEGVAWFSSKGSRTATVRLNVDE